MTSKNYLQMLAKEQTFVFLNKCFAHVLTLIATNIWKKVLKHLLTKTFVKQMFAKQMFRMDTT